MPRQLSSKVRRDRRDLVRRVHPARSPSVSIIETIVAKERLEESEKDKSKVVHDAERHVYHGMPREELDEILTTIFQEADTDRSGSLDLGEFERCLGDIRIGITRKEVKLIMFETYAKDGRIDYEAFKPLCMKLLVELTAAEWLNPSQDDADLQAQIDGLLNVADKEGSGQLALDEIRSSLARTSGSPRCRSAIVKQSPYYADKLSSLRRVATLQLPCVRSLPLPSSLAL
jgi:Ca2+-binding EF-hand superfamily protein